MTSPITPREREWMEIEARARDLAAWAEAAGSSSYQEWDVATDAIALVAEARRLEKDLASEREHSARLAKALDDARVRTSEVAVELAFERQHVHWSAGRQRLGHHRDRFGGDDQPVGERENAEIGVLAFFVPHRAERLGGKRGRVGHRAARTP